ncbi:hypothetical protein GCM10023085_39330 [Actinomadura viridis]
MFATVHEREVSGAALPAHRQDAAGHAYAARTGLGSGRFHDSRDISLSTVEALRVDHARDHTEFVRRLPRRTVA